MTDLLRPDGPHIDNPLPMQEIDAKPSSIEKELQIYHEQMEIAPDHFKCLHWKCCQHFAQPHDLQQPTDHIAASQHYQDRSYLNHDIPRLVVVSLSAPAIDPDEEQVETRSLGLHWRRTLATVRSLLDPFLDDDLPEPARYSDDESTEQVQRLFLHLRTAKCSSIQSEENGRIYEHCGSYLGGELRIAKPDVVISQGLQAKKQIERNFLILRRIGRIASDIDSRFDIDIFELNLNGEGVLWIPLYHPAIRNETFNNQAGEVVGPESERGTTNNSQSARRDNLIACGTFVQAWMQTCPERI